MELLTDKVRSLLCACHVFDVTATLILDSFVRVEAVMLNRSEYITECSGTSVIPHILLVLSPRMCSENLGV